MKRIITTALLLMLICFVTGCGKDETALANHSSGSELSSSEEMIDSSEESSDLLPSEGSEQESSHAETTEPSKSSKSTESLANSQKPTSSVSTNSKPSNNDKTPQTISVTGVSLNKTSATIEIGKTVQLSASVKPDNATNKGVTWSSSNTEIAIVSDSGSITAKATGTAIITAKTNNGKTATCKVTVNAPAASFDVNVYVNYAKSYGIGKGLIYDTSIGTGNWNAPVNLYASLGDSQMKSNIQSSINRIAYDGAERFYLYAEKQSNDSYKLYVYYG